MIAKLRAALSGFSRAVFGTWNAPPWMAFVGARIRDAYAIAAAHPRHTAALAAFIAAAAVGAHWTWRWYESRPKPVETTFTVTAPTRTLIENDQPPEPLVVVFDRSAAPIALVGKDVARGITVEPPLEGTWRWEDDKTLQLKPKEDWLVGAEYKVRLGKEALGDHIRLKDSRFTFTTAPFTASVTRAQFHQDPTDPAAKNAVFELNFSHPVNPAELEKRIVLKIADKETPRHTVSYDKLKLNAYVLSQPLATPQEDSAVELKVAKGVAAARGGKGLASELAGSVRVPGLASLVVRGVQASVAQNARAEPEQLVLVQLSATTAEKDISKATAAWLLPVNHPKQKPEERRNAYAWGDPAEVTDEILKQSMKLDLELAAGERDHSEAHAFRYNAPVGRYVYLQVERGLKSFGGYVLAKRMQHIAQVPPFPPQLDILGEGALVSLSGEKKVAILVRDVPGVRMEIGRVLPSQIQHLVSQSSGNFAKPEFGGPLSADNLTERFERKIPLNLKPGKAHYESLNLAEYLGKDASERRGVFLLKVQGYDPRNDGEARPEPVDEPEEEGEMHGEPTGDPGERSDSRLLLVTDLGILAKRSLDGTQDVFVQSIATGSPVAGATVEVIGKNGLVLFSQSTDATGRAAFPRLDGLTRERAPLLYLVRKGADMSFLPLNRRDRGLDFSRFDVGGVRNTVQPGKLSAYLFSDRGMYRPGDTFHIGLVVKSANWGRAVAGLPLEAEVLDPRGLVVKREKLKLGSGGFNEITHTTLDTAPTGTYTVNLYVVAEGGPPGSVAWGGPPGSVAWGKPADSLGSTTVKVQEFLPDRMKVTARLSTDVSDGWVHPQDLKARVNAQNLFGTPAQDRRVEASLTLRPAFPAFRGHPGYTFYDPQRAKEGYGDKLDDGTTDANGDVEFDLGLGKYARATYRLHFLARAFEPEGGRSVSAEASSLVSERAFLVGFKPDGDLGYVARGSMRTAHLVAIDPRAARIAAKDLKLEHVERRFVSVLMKQQNGTYKYVSRPKEVLVSERVIAFPATGLALALESDTPGNFFYRIRDTDGLELNRVEYSVAGAGNVTRSMDRNAELQLTLNRKSYAPGEEIEVSIRAPYVGAGLITIERDKVYAHQWFKATTQATVQKIRVPANLEGGGYVSVQYTRDPSSDEIFTSPLSYGVVPFAVDLERRTNKLTVAAPAKVKPGEPLRIKLTASQPTRAVVFAVDEGILQVARYQPPEPLAFFFQKRSLDVRTSQILDMILPEFRKLMQAAAPGGDAESALGRNLNPFKRKRDKPAVFWSGIVDVKGEADFTYAVPDTFNGTLRIFAVAVNDQAIGVAQEKTTVQGDFVLLPNAPLAVAPGDVFEVSVGVANNVASSGKDAPVAVTLKTSPALEIEGAATQALKIGAMREGVAIFRVKAKSGPAAKLGSATLAFAAAFSDAKLAGSARLATDVSVRPATPHSTRVTVGSFTGSKEVPVVRDLHAEYRATEAAVSPIPLVLASGLANYLNDFPHLCTEQLVSRAMPAIVLGKRPEFGKRGASTIGTKPFDEALAVLRARQNAEGGFGLWTASVEADEYASVYAVHMILEARERGMAVPADLLQRANTYLTQLAASPAKDLHDVRARVYAVYLLTRQGTVTTGYLAALRETLDKKYPQAWQKDSIAAYLAATYKLMKDDRQAAKLLEGPLEMLQKVGEPFRYERYYDPLIRDAHTLYLASRHFPEVARKLPLEVFAPLVKKVQDGGFNTHSAAYVVLALDAYASSIDNKVIGKLSIAEIAADGSAQALPLPENLVPRVPFSAAAKKLRFANEAALTTYYAMTEAGFDKVPPTTELKAGMEVIREYLDLQGAPVKSVKVGGEIVVKLTFRALNREAIPNVALVDLLPGGFEPVLQPVDLPAAEPASKKRAWVNRLGNVGGWNVEYADIREERVVLYGVVTSSVSEFRYRIRATNAGTFVVPPAYGESLYERDVQARSLPGSITVERAGK